MGEPACEKDMGTWVSAVYCEEQMGRLNVDEFGQSTAGDQKPVTPVDLMPLDGAWNQEAEDEDEKPHMLGEDKSTWTPDYIMKQEEEQKKKEYGSGGALGDFDVGSYMLEGYPTSNKMGAATDSLPPAWITGDEEEPACEKDMGTWVSAVYCEEQMGRLNVDEFGQSTAGDQKPVTPVDLMPLDGAWNQEEENEAEKPHMLGADESTWTPDYIMKQEEEQKDPATSTLVMKDVARPAANQSSSHSAAGLIAGCVVGAAAAAAIVAYRSKRTARSSALAEFDYSTL